MDLDLADMTPAGTGGNSFSALQLIFPQNLRGCTNKCTASVSSTLAGHLTLFNFLPLIPRSDHVGTDWHSNK